jgi:hypothetical protein
VEADLVQALAKMSAEERLVLACVALEIDPHESFDWARHPNSPEWRTITETAILALGKLAEDGMTSVAHGEALAARLVKLCLTSLKSDQM